MAYVFVALWSLFCAVVCYHLIKPVNIAKPTRFVSLYVALVTSFGLLAWVYVSMTLLRR